MSCQDEFARIVQKRGEGEPTEPVSADHQNNDWLITDLYQGEFYEDTLTGIVYYRSENGIEVVFDPSFPSGPTIYTADGSIPATTVRTVTIPTDSGLVFGVGTVLSSPGAGDGPWAWADASGNGFTGVTTTGFGLMGIADSGDGAHVQSTSGNGLVAVSNTGKGISVESQTDAGSDLAGRVLIHMFGDGETIDDSAVLHAQSTTQGFLPPRMTTVERNAISSPATGLNVYDTTTLSEWSYNGTNWIEQ